MACMRKTSAMAERGGGAGEGEVVAQGVAVASRGRCRNKENKIEG